MKKIYSFLALVFLVGMTAPVLAQEKPCINFKDPVFGTPVPLSGGNCKVDFTFTLVNDVSDPNPKSAFIEVFIVGTGQVVKSGCYLAGPAPTGTPHVMTIDSYPCNAELKWRVTRYTASTSNNIPKCQGGICGDILVLPLNITKFTARKQGQSVVLDWAAVKENIEEGEWFGIERSFDAVNFFSIASINASSQQSDYSYTDNNPATGKVFYRLALNNNTGGRKYSQIFPVTLGSSVTPKVTSVAGSGKIILADMPAGTIVTVTSMGGIVILNDVKVLGTTLIDITNAPKGMYIVMYQSKDIFGSVKTGSTKIMR